MKVVFIGASSVGPRWIMSALKRGGHEAKGIFLGYEGISLGEPAVPFHPPVSRASLLRDGVDVLGVTMDSLNIDSTLRIIEIV